MESAEEGSTQAQPNGETPVPHAEVPDGGHADDEEVTAAKDALRKAIDQRREDILACVGGDRAAVIADAVPDGAVVLSLQGDLASTPQEECLRGAVSDLRTAPRETGFTLIHLVR